MINVCRHFISSFWVFNQAPFSVVCEVKRKCELGKQVLFCSQNCLKLQVYSLFYIHTYKLRHTLHLFLYFLDVAGSEECSNITGEVVQLKEEKEKLMQYSVLCWFSVCGDICELHTKYRKSRRLLHCYLKLQLHSIEKRLNPPFWQRLDVCSVCVIWHSSLPLAGKGPFVSVFGSYSYGGNIYAIQDT